MSRVILCYVKERRGFIQHLLDNDVCYHYTNDFLVMILIYVYCLQVSSELLDVFHAGDKKAEINLGLLFF